MACAHPRCLKLLLVSTTAFEVVALGSSLDCRSLARLWGVYSDAIYLWLGEGGMG